MKHVFKTGSQVTHHGGKRIEEKTTMVSFIVHCIKKLKASTEPSVSSILSPRKQHPAFLYAQ
jgi:hypothetical protein